MPHKGKEPIQIVLPWPDKRLSPNSRVDRRRNTPVRQQAKLTGFALGRAAVGVSKLSGPLHLGLVFDPPCARRRDLDNMLGANKAHLDGISQAIGVDDSEWSLSIKRGEVFKGGRVLVSITQGE